MPALLPAAAMSAAGRRTSSLSGGDRGAGSQHRQLIEGVIRLLRSVGR